MKSKPQKWIQAAIKRPGSLHKMLGVPMGKKIPMPMMSKAMKAGGMMGRRAKMAMTLKKMNHG